MRVTVAVTTVAVWVVVTDILGRRTVRVAGNAVHREILRRDAMAVLAGAALYVVVLYLMKSAHGMAGLAVVAILVRVTVASAARARPSGRRGQLERDHSVWHGRARNVTLHAIGIRMGRARMNAGLAMADACLVVLQPVA